MSTRSTVAMRINEPAETYKAVYCHFNGDSVCKLLKAHYASREQVKSLIDLGALSYLDSETGKAFAYHRDRGEAWHRCQPKTAKDRSGLDELANEQGADYLYVFEEGRWQASKL